MDSEILASAVYHSIIIPHRRRIAHLGLCLRSIAASAKITGLDQPQNLEILVVHNASPSGPGQSELHALRGGLAERCPWGRLIVDESEMPVFCKSRLLNRGIEEARGEILTFLDADAIVGWRWLDSVCIAKWIPVEPAGIHRLCYRVKKLPLAASQAATAAGDEALEIAWRSYERLPRAFEAWGVYNTNAPIGTAPPPPDSPQGVRGQPWGNSQFSIPRAVLGELRYDEEFRGHGFEDLAMLRAISEKLGKSYRAQLLADADHALIHLMHDYEADWKSPAHTTANLRRYGKIPRPLPRVLPRSSHGST